MKGIKIKYSISDTTLCKTKCPFLTGKNSCQVASLQCMNCEYFLSETITAKSESGFIRCNYGNWLTKIAYYISSKLAMRGKQ